MDVKSSQNIKYSYWSPKTLLAVCWKRNNIDVSHVRLTVAGGDEIGDAAGLEEGAELAARVEHVHELDHLHEAEADDGRLRVVAETQPVHKARAYGHDILHGEHSIQGKETQTIYEALNCRRIL